MASSGEAMRYIAELGQTHEGDIETAIAGIEAFASAGATDIKFQVENFGNVLLFTVSIFILTMSRFSRSGG